MRLIIYILFLWPSFTSLDPFLGWVIWNVGQGQWITKVEFEQCIHIDFGGEHYSKPDLTNLCGNKRNILLITHADQDHISFYWMFRGLNHCYEKKSLVLLQKNKKDFSKNLKVCKQNPKTKILQIPNNSKSTNRNDSGLIYSHPKLTVLGDPHFRTEKFWLEETNPLTKNLVLAHHGSRTSNSQELVKYFTQINHYFVSSRFTRYGHPHWKVIERINQTGHKIISTEDFGSIAIEE